MSDKVIIEENLDEIIKNMVKNIKKEQKLSKEELDKLTKEARESVEFTKVINDVIIEMPDYRIILIDGNEQLLYDHGEFFLCDTVDSRKIKKKIKRKEATEKYIEYFIRYQLNPIIEEKNRNSNKMKTKNENIVKKEKKQTVKKEKMKEENIER